MLYVWLIAEHAGEEKIWISSIIFNIWWATLDGKSNSNRSPISLSWGIRFPLARVRKSEFHTTERLKFSMLPLIIFFISNSTFRQITLICKLFYDFNSKSNQNLPKRKLKSRWTSNSELHLLVDELRWQHLNYKSVRRSA